MKLKAFFIVFEGQSFGEKKKRKIAETSFKSALSGLKQFSTTEIPLKIMKKIFYFTLGTVFVFEIFKFLS